MSLLERFYNYLTQRESQGLPVETVVVENFYRKASKDERAEIAQHIPESRPDHRAESAYARKLREMGY